MTRPDENREIIAQIQHVTCKCNFFYDLADRVTTHNFQNESQEACGI